MSLNKDQLEAVQYFESPLLIIAGAGSGKTTVLTEKMVYAIQDLGVEPNRMLAITFTNKAANEMKVRVRNKLAGHTHYPFVSTFHGFALTVLRRNAAQIGLDPQFSILDAGDQRQLIKRIMKQLNIDESHYPIPSILSRYDFARNTELESRKILDQMDDEREIAIIERYESEKKRRNCVDFTDLLALLMRLFLNSPNILDRYHELYPFIYVDEYQDTNEIQYKLVTLLASKYQNIVVVGDFDQNIYSWRGANVQNILNFERDYPNAKMIKLEQNYRSTQTILEAANAVISHNTQRKDKRLWTANDKGDLINVADHSDDRVEANWLADSIKTMGASYYGETAILIRTNAQSRVIEASLADRSIPYRLIGAQRFFDRAEVKDILAYLKVLIAPNDDLAVARILNRPSRGIGATTINQLNQLAVASSTTLLDIMKRPLEQFPGRARSAIQSFISLINTYTERLEQIEAADVLRELIDEINAMDFYRKQDPAKGEERIENVLETVNVIRQYDGDLATFFDSITIDSEATSYENDHEKILMMTVHHAKGLEFDHVYLPGFEEGLLPHYNSIQQGDIEEERRLCYVAMTRARKTLYLSYASSRMVFGDIRAATASRFLNELPEQLIKKSEPKKGLIFQSSTKSTSDKSIPQFKPGQVVHHAAWGKVSVLEVTGEGENQMLKLNANGTIKQIMAKYAPLSP